MPVPANDLLSPKASRAVLAAVVTIVSLADSCVADAQDSASTTPGDDSIRLADSLSVRVMATTAKKTRTAA